MNVAYQGHMDNDDNTVHAHSPVGYVTVETYSGDYSLWLRQAVPSPSSVWHVTQ